MYSRTKKRIRANQKCLSVHAWPFKPPIKCLFRHTYHLGFPPLPKSSNEVDLKRKNQAYAMMMNLNAKLLGGVNDHLYGLCRPFVRACTPTSPSSEQ